MAIREAKPWDAGIVRKVVEREIKRYNKLVPNWYKIDQLISEAISSPRGFVLISEKEKLNGALVAMSAESFWAERQTATLLLWDTQVPRDGWAMLRRLMAWVESRRAIKHVEIALPLDTDPRVGVLLGRCGLGRSDVIYRKFR